MKKIFEYFKGYFEKNKREEEANLFKIIRKRNFSDFKVAYDNSQHSMLVDKHSYSLLLEAFASSEDEIINFLGLIP